MMNAPLPRRLVPRASAQRGATLIIGLILLVLITLIVVNAFTLSSSNLKAVGNMQARDEAIAAANQVVEQVVSSNFTTTPAAQTVTVDINKDDRPDYTVAVATPTCVRATRAAFADPSDVELGPGMSAGSTWNTDWDLDATVTDGATGARVRVRQGVRVLLSQSQKTLSCP
ncbi:PilX N-terminal domain-containing pilus assembly protein [Ramlibacter sp.]|uniref:PilX N-terminal domain-containing pilus assembly protein n=1 Tax=Ramlibacter sp. TaxID=1917967 RepID=UPI002CE41884|nr:PilX N-terminal domain-containing pilus assembly protein [Ramlibacter sp.]HWI83153.1 PilX N-terminal domain-containing pilus assembly protein [Ramlibacter sp.]